jgi:hypothetical protein
MPGRSALTVTPCTGATVPIALSPERHCSSRASTVVTASGGGWKSDRSVARICRNFAKPSPAITTAASASKSAIRFAMILSSVPQN